MELKLIAGSRTPIQADDPHAAKRKADREDGRLKALEFAEEALLTLVQTMRTTEDEKIRVACCDKIMNRAWGTPKATPDEDPKLANKDMLGILESISITIGAEEMQRRQVAVQAHPAMQALEAEFTEVMDDRG